MLNQLGIVFVPPNFKTFLWAYQEVEPEREKCIVFQGLIYDRDLISQENSLWISEVKSIQNY